MNEPLQKTQYTFLRFCLLFLINVCQKVSVSESRSLWTSSLSLVCTHGSLRKWTGRISHLSTWKKRKINKDSWNLYRSLNWVLAQKIVPSLQWRPNITSACTIFKHGGTRGPVSGRSCLNCTHNMIAYGLEHCKWYKYEWYGS